MEDTAKANLEEKTFSNEELNEGQLQFHYWGTMNYLVGLIKSSELKAGLILSFFGIIFNFIYQSKDQYEGNLEGFNYLQIIAILWLISTILSMYYSVRSFIPRIEKKYEANVFFFGDIISKYGDIKEYSKTFLETNVDKQKLYDQLGQQIYINAKITAAKFKNVNKSLKYLVVSIILLLIMILDATLRSAF